MRKVLLILLVVSNIMVLSGQLWPEGAPPFAKPVNIVFLVGSLCYFSMLLLRKERK